MQIIQTPNPILQTPAIEVNMIDRKIIDLIKKMSRTLEAQKDPLGVGLAAPQVGVSYQIFIIRASIENKIKVFINPHVILSKSRDKKQVTRNKKGKLEGCLSIPRIWGAVKRANRVQLEYQDESGKKFKKWFSGFEAVIIQHEMDHLTGVLFTKRVLEQGNKLYKEEEGKLVEYEI